MGTSLGLKFNHANRISTVELACLFRQYCHPEKGLAQVSNSGVTLWLNEFEGDVAQVFYHWADVITSLAKTNNFFVAYN
jgi:hypothetical protein